MATIKRNNHKQDPKSEQISQEDNDNSMLAFESQSMQNQSDDFGNDNPIWSIDSVDGKSATIIDLFMHSLLKCSNNICFWI